MTSLVFRALDKHVVAGLADDTAVQDERGPLSYAELTHESACVAGAISHLGVERGTEVAIDIPRGRILAIAVLACARLGAVPGAGGAYRFEGETFHTPDTEVAWDLLMRAGRSEPAPAPHNDPEGYEALMREAFDDLFSALLAGGTAT
ncbi:AMP-binding protein [Aeromicrobium sp.]|uniref:AMP-binding protein n=1 Tax=Aeromicrobium sp. TaxID=1871063 RepID=UPI002FC9AEB3